MLMERFMPLFTLPPLPFKEDALAPAISAETIAHHYGKHHKTYAEKAKALFDRAPVPGETLEDIMRAAANDPAKMELFNNAAQFLNHNHYWRSLSPEGGAPSAALAAQIQADFGGLGPVKAALIDKAVKHFASGWIWLGVANGKLSLLETHDADTCFLHGLTPLLTLDVWEHAYYLDYQEARERHVRALVHDLLNWNGASERFEAE